MVSTQYAATLRGSASCCVSIDSTLNGYSVEDLQTAGCSNLGLGCGNPLLLANLQEGETVIDLGSGAGIDCFLASKAVGSTGHVIGVDMTPDMIYQARQNAKQYEYSNVSFRLGEIEYLPIRDSSIDVVMSNCVINLSPDKQQVFHELFRVLKPNGRVAISDVITRDAPLPESLKTAQALACCVSGAPSGEELTNYLASAGFVNIEIVPKEESKHVISQWLPGSRAEDYVVSAGIKAVKP
jgi:arsenite methyltransferase